MVYVQRMVSNLHVQPVSWFFKPLSKLDLLCIPSSRYGSPLSVWFAPPSAVRVVYSDASETGYGGYVVEHGPCVSRGCWELEEAACTSTWRELSAVHMVLLSMAPKLVNAQVCWFTDNQNVAHILQLGSRKPDLHAISLQVFDMAVQYQIRLEPEWIPT